jgi:hypothetical protein
VSDTADTGAVDGCVPEVEVPYNGRDEDCDGADLVDVDGDGWPAARVGGDDCDDDAAAVSPDASEACGNVTDDDCDGITDEGCPVAAAGPADPGGIAWICGTPLDAAWPAFAIALALVGARRLRRQR